MRKLLLVIASLFSLSLYAQEDFDKAAKKGREVIELFKNEKYADVYAMCDSVMKRKAGLDGIQQVWDGLIFSYDELEDIGETHCDTLRNLYITTTKLKFKKLSTGLRVNFNKQYEIAGIWIDHTSGKHQTASYVNTLNFIETKIDFGLKDYPLQGTLTVPNRDGKYPCIVIVPGSGPVDRDLSIGPNKIYKDLAWGIAAKGICVFRYDKRTKIYWDKLMEAHRQGDLYNITKEYLEDIKEIMKKLSNNSHVDAKRIYIMGHSEGGSLLPLIMKNNKQVAGGIMLAGAARKMQDLMLYQFDYLTAGEKITQGQSDKIEMMKRQAKLALQGNLPKTTPDDSLPANYPFSYWNEFNKYNITETARKINKPMLILEGERDYQVPMTDYRIWQKTMEGKQNVSFYSFSTLNHLFLEGKGKSMPKEYTVKSNVPEYVIDKIVEWVGSKGKR